MEVQISKTPPSILTIKVEPKEDDCEDVVQSAFLLNKPLIKSEENDDEISDQKDNFIEDINIKSEEIHIKEDESIGEPRMPSNASVRTKEDLRLDEKKHERCQRDFKFKCDKCIYSTIIKGDLRRHQVRHMTPEEIEKLQLPIFSCNQCKYKTKRKSSLNRHFKRHKKPGEVTEFKCDKCTYKTVKEDNLRKHQIRHMTPEEVEKLQLPIFSCNQCYFKTRVKNRLNRHLLLHKKTEEVTEFKCGKCTYKTIEKGNLTKHLIRHVASKILESYNVALLADHI